MPMEDLLRQRRALVDGLRHASPARAYHSGKDYLHQGRAIKALAVFDAAHPDVIAHIREHGLATHTDYRGETS